MKVEISVPIYIHKSSLSFTVYRAWIRGRAAYEAQLLAAVVR